MSAGHGHCHMLHRAGAEPLRRDCRRPAGTGHRPVHGAVRGLARAARSPQQDSDRDEQDYSQEAWARNRHLPGWCHGVTRPTLGTPASGTNHAPPPAAGAVSTMAIGTGVEPLAPASTLEGPGTVSPRVTTLDCAPPLADTRPARRSTSTVELFSAIAGGGPCGKPWIPTELSTTGPAARDVLVLSAPIVPVATQPGPLVNIHPVRAG